LKEFGFIFEGGNHIAHCLEDKFILRNFKIADLLHP